MMLEPTVVQFNSYIVHTTLSHFTDGYMSRVELKTSKKENKKQNPILVYWICCRKR